MNIDFYQFQLESHLSTVRSDLINLSSKNFKIKTFFLSITGSVLSKDSTQRQNYITHNVQKDETLQGIALKYNVSVSVFYFN